MKRPNRLFILIFCAISCLLGATRSCTTKPVYAQRNPDVYDQEGIYISSYVDVDGNGYGYADSYMKIEFDVYGDINGIYIYGAIDQDVVPFVFGSAHSTGEYVTAEISGDFSPAPPGHTYGVDTDGYINFEAVDGEGGGQYVASTYAQEYVAPPPPPPPPPMDPCDVTSNPQAGYSSIVSTGMAGGSGTMAVSFSGAAYAALSPRVSYGSYSTPSSIAASIAALITKNYLQYGLSAKAFGPNIVYSGNAALGTVSNPTSGPSFTTTTSTGAATETQMACKNAPPAPKVKVETTVVAWIDGSAVTLPSGASPMLLQPFPLAGPGPLSYGYCEGELFDLAHNDLGFASSTSADAAYANAWLVKYSANTNPGPSIIPSTFTSFNYQYRLFADYSPSQGISNTSIGYTPDPCGTPGVHVQGVPYSQNGYYTGDANGTGTSQLGFQYLLAETRAGTTGQTGWKTLNNQELPWVWSVIEFDQNGYAVRYQNMSTTNCGGIPTSVNYQIFPSYSVYMTLPGTKIGTLYTTLGQNKSTGSVAAFTNLPPGQALNRSCIP